MLPLPQNNTQSVSSSGKLHHNLLQQQQHQQNEQQQHQQHQQQQQNEKQEELKKNYLHYVSQHNQQQQYGHHNYHLQQHHLQYLQGNPSYGFLADQQQQQQQQQQQFISLAGVMRMENDEKNPSLVKEEEVVDSDELLSDDDENNNAGNQKLKTARNTESQRTENGAGDDDVDDDDDDDDEDELESEEEDEEYQEYQKFISSIFRDDFSDVSGTDGDEDEDYCPEDAGPLLRLRLEEDEDTDDEYFKVTRKEVYDLVDSSLQVLAKNNNTCSAAGGGGHSARDLGVAGSTSQQPNEGGRRSKKHSAASYPSSDTLPEANATASTSSSTVGGLNEEHNFEQLEQNHKRNRLISAVVRMKFAGENEDNLVVDDLPIHNIRKIVARQMSMSLQLMIQMLLLSENLSESDRLCSSHLMELSNLRSSALTKTYLITEQMETLEEYASQRLKGSSSGSSSNSNSSSSSGSSSVGNSVSNIDCSNNGSLVSSPQKRNNSSKQSHNTMRSVLFDADEEDDDEDEEEDDMMADECNGEMDSTRRRPRGYCSSSHSRRQQLAKKNLPVTRNRAANDPSLTRMSSSIFNIPTLSRVHVLLQAIDSGRKARDVEFNKYVAMKKMQSLRDGSSAEDSQSRDQHSASGDSRLLAGWMGSDSGSRGYLTSITHEERTAIFQITAEYLEQQIAPSFCVRLWKCLLPSSNYPLSPDFVKTVNPASLYGSTIFTPAEDDLLLRGIISVNNSEDKEGKAPGQWEKRVKEKFLPSKEEQLLQYRQIQLSTGPEDSKFKRYRIFEMEKQRQQKWSHEEDKELLKGFQVFGSKWYMIKLYFLPNKSRNEIKLRWSHMVKDWEKNFNNTTLKAVVKSDGKLVKSMKKFLSSLRSSEVESSSSSGIHGVSSSSKYGANVKHSSSQPHFTTAVDDSSSVTSVGSFIPSNNDYTGSTSLINTHNFNFQPTISSYQNLSNVSFIPRHNVPNINHPLSTSSTSSSMGPSLLSMKRRHNFDDDKLIDAEVMSDSDSGNDIEFENERDTAETTSGSLPRNHTQNTSSAIQTSNNFSTASTTPLNKFSSQLTSQPLLLQQPHFHQSLLQTSGQQPLLHPNPPIVYAVHREDRNESDTNANLKTSFSSSVKPISIQPSHPLLLQPSNLHQSMLQPSSQHPLLHPSYAFQSSIPNTLYPLSAGSIGHHSLNNNLHYLHSSFLQPQLMNTGGQLPLQSFPYCQMPAPHNRNHAAHHGLLLNTPSLLSNFVGPIVYPDGLKPLISEKAAPIDMLLAQKSIPALLGKKRKKEDLATKSAISPVVQPPTTLEKNTLINLAADQPLDTTTLTNGSVLLDTNSKKSRSVRFAEPQRGARASNVQTNQTKTKANSAMFEEDIEESSFRLFDSVMMGANKGKR